MFGGSVSGPPKFGESIPASPKFVEATPVPSTRGANRLPEAAADARQIVQVLWALPGDSTFRRNSADVVVRYLGGDPRVIDEVIFNRRAQEALARKQPNHPARGRLPRRVGTPGISTTPTRPSPLPREPSACEVAVLLLEGPLPRGREEREEASAFPARLSPGLAHFLSGPRSFTRPVPLGPSSVPPRRDGPLRRLRKTGRRGALGRLS